MLKEKLTEAECDVFDTTAELRKLTVELAKAEREEQRNLTCGGSLRQSKYGEA